MKDSWRIGLGIAAALPILAAHPAEAREPTEYEQYMVELVNRARVVPEAEVLRLGTGDLNEGPPVIGPWEYTIPPGRKQPVAVSFEITDAADEYAQRLNDNDAFCHGCLGDSSEERMWVAGYVDLLSHFDFFDLAGFSLLYGGAQDPDCVSGCLTWVPGRENLAFRGEFPNNGGIDDLLAAIDEAHTSLFNDFTIPGRGHRSTMLYGEWREVGIAMVEGTDPGNIDSVYMVQNFAHRADRGPFLTGVAYDDRDGDGFYTPNAGEALGDVTITVREAGGGPVVATTQTWSAGGYQVELPVGVYDVTAAGPGVSRTFMGVEIAATGPKGMPENTKLDVVPVPEPGSLGALGAGIGLLLALRRRRAR